MNPDQVMDKRWIEIKPSNVNLALTLLAPLFAAGAVVVIEMPDWVRAVLLTLLFVATIADVYLVRHLSAGAVSAFYLFELDTPDRPDSVRPVVSGGESSPSQHGAQQGVARQLGIRLRYRYPAKRGGEVEAEGVVGSRAYVSTYFTSIPYRLLADPGWRRWFPRVVSVWADGIDREAFRRVRVQLKWL